MSRKGVTLLETLVACALFAFLTGLIVTIQIASKNAARRSDLGNEVYRAAMLAAERLRQEFRGARVESVAAGGTSITYWLPRIQNGVLQVLPTGEPDWEPGDPAPPDRAVLSMAASGWLQRDFQGNVRRMAFLGPTGSITFDLPTGSRVLTARVNARHQHPNDPSVVSTYAVTLRFFLGNQP